MESGWSKSESSQWNGCLWRRSCRDVTQLPAWQRHSQTQARSSLSSLPQNLQAGPGTSELLSNHYWHLSSIITATSGPCCPTYLYIVYILHVYCLYTVSYVYCVYTVHMVASCKLYVCLRYTAFVVCMLHVLYCPCYSVIWYCSSSLYVI